MRSGFSIVEGGPLHDLGRRLGLPGGRAGFLGLGLALALLTWVPLLVLTAGGGVLLSGADVPFLASLGTHTRLLVAIPLFFAAEAAFNARAGQAVRALVTAQVIPPRELPRLEAAVRGAIAWRDAWYIEAALVVLTFVLIWDGHVRTDLPRSISTWRTTAGGQFTPAGWWYTLVSLPVFQFLIWRWCARLLVWWQFLWRMSRWDLRLVPTHPDRAGGLGPLGVVHVTLAILGFAASAMLAASFAEEILYGDTAVEAFVLPLAGAVAGSTLVFVAPLLFFSTRLIEVKQQGVLEYGVLASEYVRTFDEKWLRGERSSEPLVGSADIQSLADLGNGFQAIRSMGVVPIAPSQVLLLVVASILPLAPLVLFVVPIDRLIIDGVRRVLNL